MRKLYYFLPVAVVPAMLLLVSYHTGSPGGRTGSPGDNGNTCTGCHTGTANNAFGWITTNVPATGYVGGQTYTITATGTHTGVVLFGFELTVEDSQGNKVGTLQLTDPVRTKFINGGDAVTHTDQGITPSGNSNTWSVNWVAPTGVQGNVGIYAAFNAANGNGNTSGDVIYKSSIFISPYSPPPALASISPDEAEQGDSFLATITGTNTNFTGSPSVSMTYSLNPGEVINGTSVTVISPTVITAQFSLPFSASTGLWDVHVNALVLEDGFTVTEALPALSFMSPNFAHQGDAFTGTVYGINTGWTGTPAVWLSYSNNPGEIITGTNVVVVNGTELTADFVVPSDASTGNYTLHVDDLSQTNAFTVLAGQVPALASISPDNAEQGILVNTTITGENTSWVGTTPVVLLSLSANPSETIPGTNVVVVNSTTLTADFDIPFEATPGIWDLYADALVLENAFTVVDVVPVLVSIDPASATQGDQVTTLITATDSRFTLGVPEVSLSFPGLPGEIIEASQVNVLNDTQLEATFIIPENASPGLWDLHVDEMMLTGAFTVNMLIGLGDNLLALVSVYPNPASERMIVENAHGADLAIYSSAGELVVARRIGSGKQIVDVSALPAGVYVVKLLMEGKAKIEKLLVN
jgi:hypothetical protein